jgi:hypothetical protein
MGIRLPLAGDVSSRPSLYQVRAYSSDVDDSIDLKDVNMPNKVFGTLVIRVRLLTFSAIPYTVLLALTSLPRATVAIIASKYTSNNYTRCTTSFYP